MMLLAGIGMLVPRSARIATLVLSGFTALWVLFLHLPRALSQPANAGFWLGVGEVSTLASGGWLIYCALTARDDKTVHLIVWVSAVLAAPTDRQHWVDLFISTALTGAAWAVAESYRGRSQALASLSVRAMPQ